MTLPDVDAMLLDFLGPVLNPVKAYLRVPSSRPDEFVVARRNGGGAASRVLDFPTVTVDAWAKSTTRAEEMASVAREALLNGYTAMPLVRGVEELTGPYLSPDPETNLPVYRLSVRLSVRASRS
ncbi:hypothetical protein [Microbacterium gilvum]|uniref:DUF3168 domain-containing protein n=1 Tax=Microbacterium gilvum TaxID=1336204 RepID=A0ABP9A7D0_9MICO